MFLINVKITCILPMKEIILLLELVSGLNSLTTPKLLDKKIKL